MQKRPLGFSDLQLTTIGFGAWAIGGGNWEWGWGPQQDQDSLATIQKALDLGINWIDTAAAYGLGHSEEIVGQAIRGRREDLIIATKCGLVWEDPSSGQVINHLKAESVRREAEASLRRLNLDVIDIYQVHWPVPDVDLEEAWSEIALLIEEGKVRYGGLSNADVNQIKRCQAIHPVASVQPPYSMLDRDVEDELLTFCAENNIGVLAYSPMGSGLLTGKYTRERVKALPAEDWRLTKESHFQEPELAANLELVKKLEDIARSQNHSVGELAVAWVLRRPELTAAIVGSRRPDQIEQIAPASNWQLDEHIIQEINSLLEERDRKVTVVT